MATATAAYNPANRGNPEAAARAVYYVSRYGTAAAALSEIENPGYDDAFERTVCDELRVLRHIEQSRDAYPFNSEYAAGAAA